MNRLTFLIFTFLISIFLSLPAISATIEGYEPEYAGQTLIFKIYTDPITKNEKELFSIIIDENGHFKKNISVEETNLCHSDFGVYHGLLMIEPQSSLTLKLPIFREKTLLESKNPYFEPLVIWLPTESDNNNEINTLVSNLEKKYVELTNKYFNQLYFRRSKTHLDSVRNILQNEFGKYSHPVIKNQLSFKLKILDRDLGAINEEEIFKDINPDKQTLACPAFEDLLNLVFSNKLSFETNSIKGAELKTAVSNSNIIFIKNYFQEKYGLTSAMAEYVILKLVHDAWYTKQFPEKSIISIIDNPLFSNHSNKNIRDMAIAIKEKLLFLSPGSKAPVICLNNQNGKKQCSDNREGYKYLIFADSEMLVCIEHLKYLKTLEQKFEGQLNFFIVLKDTGIEGINRFLNENEIPGIKVVDNEEVNASSTYKVRSYPSAFLLNEKHEVVLAPAKNPLDGFEFEFASILRAEQIQKLRNQR